MSYLVLARKYRPQTFAALIGQAAIVRTLKNAMALGRVHHAFVLAGSRGVGKTSTARLLAKGLNCAEGPTTEPCDACPSCQGIASGHAPAVIEIDGASNTGVDHVRELRESAQYRPQMGRFKVYIVDEVHMLSQAAFNALLKVLEEPPAHVKFIFATTEPHKIPSTILSRCQRFDFRRVPMTELMAHLRSIAEREQVRITDGALGMVAREAQGSVRDSLSLLDQAIGFAGHEEVTEAVLSAMGAIDRSVLFRLLDAVLAREAAPALQVIDDIDKQGHDFAEVARLLLTHVRDVALAGALRGDQALLEATLDGTPEQKERLSEQATCRGQEDWQRLFEKLAAVTEAVARSPVPKATLEMGILRLMQIAPAADVGKLIARLDGYMATVPAGAGDTEAVSPPARDASALVSAAPVAPQAPASVATGEQNVHAEWRGFVAHVRKQRPSLASLLEHGQVVTFRAKETQLAFASGSFCLDALSDADNRVLVEKMLHEKFGEPTRFSVVAAQKSQAQTPTLAEQRERDEQRAWQQKEQAARNHPAVRGAIETLGAQIRSVEPYAPAAP